MFKFKRKNFTSVMWEVIFILKLKGQEYAQFLHQRKLLYTLEGNNSSQVQIQNL